jgi:shikimate kinase
MIVLIGYMGSGKSSVGRLLAKKLNMSFVDLDEHITEREQLTIPDIFKIKGEIYFRKRETFYLTELLEDSENQILSLGGGTPCYSKNMDLILHSGAKSIYLKASIPTLFNRLKKETINRPMVSHLKTDQELTEFIGKHLFERQFFYQQADIIITTDDKTPEDIVESILAIIN